MFLILVFMIAFEKKRYQGVHLNGFFSVLYPRGLLGTHRTLKPTIC